MAHQKIYISLPKPKCFAAISVRPASDGAVHAARYTSQRTELQIRIWRWAFYWQTSRFSSASPIVAAEENDCHRTGTGDGEGGSQGSVLGYYYAIPHNAHLRTRMRCAILTTCSKQTTLSL